MCVIGKDTVTVTCTAPLNLNSTYLQLTGSSAESHEDASDDAILPSSDRCSSPEPQSHKRRKECTTKLKSLQFGCHEQTEYEEAQTSNQIVCGTAGKVTRRMT
ncbi:uncharacterized protein LOC127870456 isoform X2 [Dreissena polymorpha]|uniref:uncharacterized protein LOC127870456 isoform X2 n=1 Tax=Dreissena polymorpha TaxID=45954 RepID=UPI002263D7FB|nr:uncharacterized protein LOC127870456 isoform X2 [Dreissena polymorpha]